MTFHEFKQTILHKNRFDRYWFYGISGALIATGLFLLFYPFARPPIWHDPSGLYIAFCCFLIALGGYAWYKLSNRFKILTLPSNRPIAEKTELLDQLMASFDSKAIRNSKNYMFYIYQRGFWYSSYQIHLFYDTTQVAFSVQAPTGTGGFIDLGGTERVRQRITSELELLLAYGSNDLKSHAV